MSSTTNKNAARGGNGQFPPANDGPPNKKPKLDPPGAIASDTASPSRAEISGFIPKLPPDAMQAALTAFFRGDVNAAQKILQDSYKEQQANPEMYRAWKACQVKKAYGEWKLPEKLDPATCLPKDVWVGSKGILSFIGPGNFANVAGVCHQWKIDYGEYFATIEEKDIPRVRFELDEELLDDPDGDVRPATMKDTFDSSLEEIFKTAAKHSNLEALEWTRQQGREWSTYNCAWVAEVGLLEILRFLHEEGCEWSEYTCEAAAKGGQLKCLQYAHEKGCEWDEGTCMKAAGNGHLACLKYAHNNGCEWDETTCYSAAHGGHLDCLQYAHKRKCPWDKLTCACAAARGHLECLQYAHDNACPWNEWTCEGAARGGHLEVLQYARSKGCPWGWTYRAAMNNGHNEIAEWAMAHGCPVGEEEIE